MISDIKAFLEDASGSAAVEMSFVMPVVIFAVIFCLKFLLGSVTDVKKQEQKYSDMYTYEYGMYKTTFDKCTSRLRRWQMYGDIFQE